MFSQSTDACLTSANISEKDHDAMSSLDTSKKNDSTCSSPPQDPITKEESDKIDTKIKKKFKNKRRKASFDARDRHEVHAPIAYSLIVHPPIILENLLPEDGVFELMHAARRQVVWWGFLKAGESKPIHNVGLDAPLLLLLNLGFCRTPHGEGALIHDGLCPNSRKKGSLSGVQGGWNPIGKAVKHSKQKVRATLATISESSGEKEKGRITKSKHNKVISPKSASNKLGFDDAGFELDDKVRKNMSSSFSSDNIATQTEVVDSLGEKLSLCIDNILGGGGQRRVIVYCPFWILNTTEHPLRYKQEGSSIFVSGTVISSQRDGSKPVDGSYRNRISVQDKKPQQFSRGTIFAGTRGALATSAGNRALDHRRRTMLMSKELPLDQVASLAFMFNFHDFTSSNQKLCVQLADSVNKKYNSDWSMGISLESVGVTQIIGMHCKDNNALEVSVSIGVAAGRVSPYTKIVRFSPRYVLVNQIERPIRFWQDSSLLHSNFAATEQSRFGVAGQQGSAKWHLGPKEELASGSCSQYEYLFGGSTIVDDRGITEISPGSTAHRSALFIATAGLSEFIPFHLPDTRADRQLRIDFGSTFNLTSSFPADITGDYALKVTRAFDYTLLNHVTTRASPTYTVVLPPIADTGGESGGVRMTEDWDGELGVWFETTWGQKEILVKGTKRGKYSFNNTDIHVGDQLLYVDDIPVSSKTFSETMKLLKERLAAVAELHRQGANAPRNKKQPVRPMFRRSSNRTISNASSHSDAQNRPKIVLTFRTLEERMRRVRSKSLKARGQSGAMSWRNSSASTNGDFQTKNPEAKSCGSSRSSITCEQIEIEETEHAMSVEMKLINQSIFIFIRPFDIDNPPYRIDNRAVNHTVYFRQRGCDGHPWASLAPGERSAYIWSEPMKQKKLSVRVGSNRVSIHQMDKKRNGDIIGDRGKNSMGTKELCFDEHEMKRDAMFATPVKLFYSVENEEQGALGPTRTVKLEEIGFKDTLPCPSRNSGKTGGDTMESERHLFCRVDTEGATRVLIVSDSHDRSDDTTLLQQHLDTLTKKIRDEERKKTELEEIAYLLRNDSRSTVFAIDEELSNQQMHWEDETEQKEELRATSPPLFTIHETIQGNEKVEENDDLPTDSDRLKTIEDQIKYVADFPEGVNITSTNQVFVQVIETRGLKASDLSGLSNPYCEVYLKKRAKKKSQANMFTTTKKSKTYYVEKNLSPRWYNQCFVFDVPHEAAEVTRGYSIRVRVRNFGFLRPHNFLGQTDVHLRSLRNQEELIGWYPLTGKTRRDFQSASSDYVRGSVKLRVQWIYSVPALLDYCLLLSEKHLNELLKSKNGMEGQLASLKALQKQKQKISEPANLLHLPAINYLDLAKNKKYRTNHPSHPKRMAAFMSEVTNSIAASSQEKSSAWKNRRKSITGDGKPDESGGWTLQKSMKIAREWSLSSLKFQTVESRIRRQIMITNELPSSSNSAAENVTDASPTQKSTSVTKNGTRELLTAAAATFMENSSVLYQQESEGRSFAENDFLRRNLFEGSRNRSLSLHQSIDSSRTNNVDDNDSHLYGLSTCGSMEGESNRNSLTQFDISTCRYDDGFLNAADADEAQRNDKVNLLFEHGLLFHEYGNYCHRHHLTHHIRANLAMASTEDDVSLYFFPSHWNAPPTISRLRSWVEAQVYLNDEIANRLFKLPQQKCREKFTKNDETNADEKLESTSSSKNTNCADHDKEKYYLHKRPEFKMISRALRVPSKAPSIMKRRAKSCANDLTISRLSFSRAAKRSLSTVLNPGGWLTIRPITALNLPNTNNGMYVKLSYGSVNILTKAVDARVSPKWTEDDISLYSRQDDPDTPFPTEGNGDDNFPQTFTPDTFEKSKGMDKGFDVIYEYQENDLQVYVEPLKTSGSLILSVIEERLQSDVELGTLHIPLGSALSCCNECIEDYREEIISSRGSKPPAEKAMYIRWFPLMNPKDCIAVDGDMGFSSRPAESEKKSDHLFNQFYQPCIKLALIWQPDVTDRVNINENGENEHLSPFDANVHKDGDHSPFCLPILPYGYGHGHGQIITYFQAFVESISAALIDSHQASELLSFSSTDLDFRYLVSKAKTRVGVAVGWLQLDHQDENAREPVVISPTPVVHPQPTVQILAVKDNLRSKSNLDSYEYIAIALQELDVHVEEAWLFSVWEFYISLIRRREAQKKTRGKKEVIVIIHPSFATCSEKMNKNSAKHVKDDHEILSSSAGKNSKKIYVEQLMLGFVKINLSYIKSVKGTRSMVSSGQNRLQGKSIADNGKNHQGVGQATTANPVNKPPLSRQFKQSAELFRRWSEHSSDEEFWTEGGGKFAHNLPRFVSAVFPSITNAPVRLQGKIIEHVFETVNEIVASLKNYYVNETLRQIYKIVGSVDFVGNPTMVLSSFMTGVRDFFFEPSIAFLRSPKNPSRLGLGVVRGTLSLLSHSTSGIFGLAARLSATAGRAAATLSMDNNFQQRHAEQLAAHAKAKKPSSCGKQFAIAVARPVNDILFGAMEAVTGVIYEPYRGAKEEGATGLAKGIGIGVVGVVTKPITGIFDAFAHITECIHDVAKSVNIIEKRYEPARKRRLPYVFGINNLLIPFNPIDARSIELLRRKTVMMSDEYLVLSEVLHMEPGLDAYVVVTTRKVVMFKLKREGGGPLKPLLCWQVDLKGVVTSNLENKGHNGVVLYVSHQATSPQKCNEVGISKLSTHFGSYSMVGEVEDKRALQKHHDIGNNNTYLQSSIQDESQLVRPSSFGESVEEDDIDMTNSPSQSNDWEMANLKMAAKTVDQQTNPTLMKETYHHLHWTGREGKGEDTLEGYVVIGEFHHRPQLARIHNAICCLTHDFESLIRENGLGPEGSDEGYLAFNYMQFQNVQHRPMKTDQTDFYFLLENISWRPELISSPLQSYKEHEDRFTNVLEASQRLGGPRWLIEARARATYTPSNMHPNPHVFQGYTRRRDERELGTNMLQGERIFDVSQLSNQEEMVWPPQQVPLGRTHGQDIVRSTPIAQRHERLEMTPRSRSEPHITSSPASLNTNVIPFGNEISLHGRLDRVESMLIQFLQSQNQMPDVGVSFLSSGVQRMTSSASDSLTQSSGADMGLESSSVVEGKRELTTENLKREIEYLRSMLAERDDDEGDRAQRLSRARSTSIQVHCPSEVDEEEESTVKKKKGFSLFCAVKDDKEDHAQRSRARSTSIQIHCPSDGDEEEQSTEKKKKGFSLFRAVKHKQKRSTF